MEEKVRIQDDLYEAINGEWLKNAVIPDDRPSTGGFSQLDQDVEKLLMADFALFAENKKSTDIAEMKDAILLYKKVLDVKRRNEEGIKPLLPLLDLIKNIKNVSELNKLAKELVLEGVDLPFNLGVTADMNDATKNAFILTGPDTILPDTSYYQEGNPVYGQLIGLYANMAKNALAQTPLTQEEQELFLNDTLEYDKLIAKTVKSQVEWADYVKNNNPTKVEEVIEQLKPFDFAKLLKDIYGAKAPKIVVVYDPRAIKEFNTVFNDENFNKYVHWCYVKTLIGKSGALSLELAANSTIFRRALYGIAKDPVLEKQAYQVVAQAFSEPVGVYYGRTYFGEEAKKDIVSLVKKIIETYKTRVANNKFLEDATKKQAIKKLSTIEIKMGYPDEIRPLYKLLKVDENDSYYVAINKLKRVRCQDNLDKLHKPVDRTEWAMPGHMVNACYNPNSNDITFPAAILQKPFYSIDQTISENLGGIGAVIGHEISHAFDNNGSQFDEKGNVSNWWTEKDYESFKKLTNDMIAQWDGIPFHGGKVNGELVVSENIADNGGMAVTIEIMHNTKGSDFKEYFSNWARVWCQKMKEEMIQYLLANDVHSPAKLRANIPPRNFSEWYETFGVTEKDEMYIAPEKRLIIW